MSMYLNVNVEMDNLGSSCLFGWLVCFTVSC